MTWKQPPVNSLTYELDGLQEPAADVLFMVVLDWDALVLVRPLKVVGTVGRHVQQGGDSDGVQHLLLGGVDGAAQVEEGEDLDRAGLERERTDGRVMIN